MPLKTDRHFFVGQILISAMRRLRQLLGRRQRQAVGAMISALQKRKRTIIKKVLLFSGCSVWGAPGTVGRILDLYRPLMFLLSTNGGGMDSASGDQPT